MNARPGHHPDPIIPTTSVDESRRLVGDGMIREIRRRLDAQGLAPAALPPAAFLTLVEAVARDFCGDRSTGFARERWELLRRQVWTGRVPSVPTADELAAA